MAQATFSWPFGPIHLESACLRFRLAAKTAPAPLFLLFPANPLRWASPGVTMDWEKRHRGRLRMSASRSYSPLPGPHYRGDAYLLGCVKFPARGNLSGWSKFPPAHWGLTLWKIAPGAAPQPRLALMSQRTRPVFRRRGGTLGRPETADEDIGPTKEQKRLRMRCRGGCPHPPTPKCSDLPVGAAPCGRPRFPEPNLSPTTPKGALSTDRRNTQR